ncbi:MAG: hypothetical protein KGI54_17085 [Pseudomonadota bacterium]|nr:hypothetical protein [Pseudomonadota bacterium]
MSIIYRADDFLLENLENLWAKLPINPYITAKYGIWASSIILALSLYTEHPSVIEAFLVVLFVLMWSILGYAASSELENRSSQNYMNTYKLNWFGTRWLQLILAGFSTINLFSGDPLIFIGWLGLAFFVFLMCIDWIKPLPIRQNEEEMLFI